MEGEATAPARMAAARQFHLYIAAKLENKVLLRLVTGLLDQGERPWAQQFAIHFDNAETCTAVLARPNTVISWRRWQRAILSKP